MERFLFSAVLNSSSSPTPTPTPTLTNTPTPHSPSTPRQIPRKGYCPEMTLEPQGILWFRVMFHELLTYSLRGIRRSNLGCTAALQTVYSILTLPRFSVRWKALYFLAHSFAMLCLHFWTRDGILFHLFSVDKEASHPFYYTCRI